MTATPSRSSPVPGLSIREAASRLGASVHTLRYYEREGLLSVPRLESAQRRYGPADLELLRFLLALRATGMPMVLIRRYMALVRLGEATVSERRDLLLEHQRAVVAQIAALQGNLSAIDHKIEKYDRMGGCAPRGAN
ncbi:MAG: MerR family transcriptional regulator [Deinococcus sp.]